MITREEAERQGAALLAAAAASPMRQYRYELGRRGKEWVRAASTMGDNEVDTATDGFDEWVIELVGSVVPGMQVPAFDEYRTVIRSMTRDGQLTLHCEDGDGRPVYLNFVGSASPVVVKA